MSSSDLMISPPDSPDIFGTTSSDDGANTFAQTKEPFDVDSNSDTDESEGGIEIYFKNPISENHPRPLSADFTSPVEQQSSLQTGYSTTTTSELVQYARDADFFAANCDSHKDKFLMSPNQDAEDLAKLTEVTTRARLSFGSSSDDHVESSELMYCGETGTFTKVKDFAKEGGGSEMYHFPTQKDFTQVEDFVKQPISITNIEGMPQVRDFASQPLPPVVEVARASLAGINLRVEDVPERAISPMIQHNNFQSLAPAQEDHSNTYASSDQSSSNFFGEKPAWEISSEEAEGFHRSLLPMGNITRNGIEYRGFGNAIYLTPPSAPKLKNLTTPNLSERSILADDMKDWVQVLPKRPKKSSQEHKEIQGPFTVGETSANSSPKSIDPPFATPPQSVSLSEQGRPRVFYPPPISAVGTPFLHKPAPFVPRIPQHRDISAWPPIALVLDIPVHPSHPLTSAALHTLALREKFVQLEKGYIQDELHQWALAQHRILLWINSGALDDGIDGMVEGGQSIVTVRTEDVDGSEGSHLWDYEDVEVYARYEQAQFRRNMEWVQDAEGSVGSVCTLKDEIYDFRGHDDIRHRSVSELSSESSMSYVISKEYHKDEDEPKPSSSAKSHCLANQKKVIDYFRALDFLKPGANVPSLARASLEASGGNGITPAEFARAKAKMWIESVKDAQDAARREKEALNLTEALRSEIFPSVPRDMPETILEWISGYEGKVTMRGGADPERHSEDDSESSSDSDNFSRSGKKSTVASPVTDNSKATPEKEDRQDNNSTLSVPTLRSRLQTQVDKIPPRFSLFCVVRNLNERLQANFSAPGIIINAIASLPSLISNILPRSSLSPFNALRTSSEILSAHEPLTSRMLGSIAQIPSQIQQLPDRAKEGIEELAKRKAERAKRQEERAKLVEAATTNNVPPEIDFHMLTLKEQIWKNIKENMFKKRWSWEYEDEPSNENTGTSTKNNGEDKGNGKEDGDGKK